MSHPSIGDVAEVRYNPIARGGMPYHGKLGRIRVVCRARPRNHGVWFAVNSEDGADLVVAIPAGNLRPTSVADAVRRRIAEMPERFTSEEFLASLLVHYGVMRSPMARTVRAALSFEAGLGDVVRIEGRRASQRGPHRGCSVGVYRRVEPEGARA